MTDKRFDIVVSPGGIMVVDRAAKAVLVITIEEWRELNELIEEASA